MRSGLTQLELIVVLVVGGVLIALAVPRLVGLRDAFFGAGGDERRRRRLCRGASGRP